MYTYDVAPCPTTTGSLTVATTLKATVLSSPSGRYFSLHTKISPQCQLHISPPDPQPYIIRGPLITWRPSSYDITNLRLHQLTVTDGTKLKTTTFSVGSKGINSVPSFVEINWFKNLKRRGGGWERTQRTWWSCMSNFALKIRNVG